MAQNTKSQFAFRLLFLLSIWLQNSSLRVSAEFNTNIMVYEGYPVQLQCVCSSYNSTWKFYKNSFDEQGDLIYHNDNVTVGFRGRFDVDINEIEYLSLLKSENVSIQDTGYYLCYCNYTNKNSKILLQVVPNGYPKCSVWSTNTRSMVEYGKVKQKVILSCDSGFESNYPTIRWIKEGKQTPIESSFRNIKVLNKTLTLTANDEDMTYTCYLGIVDVLSPPFCSVMPYRYRPSVSIDPKVAEKNVGENVTFTCSVEFKKEKSLLQPYMIFAWNDFVQDQFSGRFILDNENRSLHLLDLKHSDDQTALHCRVTIRRTGARDKAVAVLRVNYSLSTPFEPYTSTGTQNHFTSFIYTNATKGTLYASPSYSGSIATSDNSFHLSLWLPVLIVLVGVITLGLGMYTIHERRSNSINRLPRRMLSVKYEEIKPKHAAQPKSNDQIDCGIVRPMYCETTSEYEELPE